MYVQTHQILRELDICKILENNNLNHPCNIFEIVKKNITKYCNRQNDKGTHFNLIEARMVSVKINQSNFSLVREMNRLSSVIFVNMKNENGDLVNSLIEKLHKNDRILIINALPYRTSTVLRDIKLTIVVKPEINSSVFLFKCGSSSIEQLNNPKNSLIEKNLSEITDTGVYSLFGFVNKILKYTDEDIILLRLKCSDKSCIKTRKYSYSDREFKNISKEEIASGLKYDSYSNKVDILVLEPCVDFMSLILNQRILLNNIKVKFSNNLDVFSFHMKGRTENLKADPIETVSVKSLRAPTKQFPIPNELKPTISKPKSKQISSSAQLNQLDKFQVLTKTDHPSKQFSLSTKQSEHQTNLLSISDDDDDINTLPCEDFFTFKHSHYRENYSSNKITNLNNQNQISKNNLPIRLTNEAGPSLENNHYLKRKISHDFSSDGSCSPPFFQIPLEVPTSIQEIQSNESHLSNVNQVITRTTRCIGSCRLIHIEPNIFFNYNRDSDQDIISGYCQKCLSFYPKASLIKLDKVFRCPKCSSTAHLTFFFKMNYLYGKNEKQAIEVCCYNGNAEHVIKKLLKINIKPKNYMLNPNYKKLVMDTIMSLIINKTKVNIIVSESPDDNINILQSIDTKYIVTTPI